MNHAVLSALVATCGTWLLTALGAAVVVFFKNPNRRLMNLMLGFAAGVMIAASFWSLLQPAIEQARAYLRIPAWAVATLGFLAGALFMFASDKARSGASARRRGREGAVHRARGFSCWYFPSRSTTFPRGLRWGLRSVRLRAATRRRC